MYDVIVVGARCAGSASALELARRGHQVLVVDRTPPSAGHVPPAGSIVGPGVLLLEHWGLLDQVRDTGCPPVRRVRVRLGDASFDVPLVRPGVVDAMYVAERNRLDPVLCDAAAAAGAEVRSDVRVTALHWEHGRVVGIEGEDASGRRIQERAPVVVGADGKHSFVARAAGAGRYRVRAAGLCGYHAFWSGAVDDEFEMLLGDGHQCLVFPMRDRRSWVVALRPADQWQAFRADPEAEYAHQLTMFPTLAASLEGARRVSRLWGTADLDGFFRPAVGPGWVLVGDAGHTKDPGRGRGISDALVQAHLMAGAIDEFLTGVASWDDALGQAARTRDAVFIDLHDLTHDLADAATVGESLALLPRVQEADDRQLSWLVDRLSRTEASCAG